MDRILSHKLEGFGTTIFAEMSALAVATGSINLGQGFPDTDGPEEVRCAAIEAIEAGRGNQYPPGPGIPELRAAVDDHQRAYYGIELDPDRQVLITCGATEALASSMLSLLDDGDECIPLRALIRLLPACVQMAGARVVPVTLRAPDFQPDPDALRAAVHAAHADDRPQLAAQPDRRGVHARVARGRRCGRGASTTCWSWPTRPTST